jgi:hypothetical protein
MPADEPHKLRIELLALLETAPIDEPLPENVFDDIALRIFRFQFERNAPYRAYCERRGVSPDSIATTDEIPAVPTAAFKEIPLVSGDADAAEVIFRTSGTTRGAERRGAHYIADIAMYHAALLPSFGAYLLPDAAVLPILCLVPHPNEVPDSSLSHMAGVVVSHFGAPDSAFVAHNAGIDYDTLFARLELHEQQHQPVLLFATSLAMVHVLEEMERTNRRFLLPAGSRLLDTGGFKGTRRDVSPDDLRAQYGKLLGIPATHCVNEYGMTEMCSQFYDDGLRAFVRNVPSHRHVKRTPPWVRTTVVDPETLAPLREGLPGLLRHFDMANYASVSAIQTEDVGVAVEGGFLLHGRAPGAAPRGCSIAMDMLLDAARERQ